MGCIICDKNKSRVNNLPKISEKIAEPVYYNLGFYQGKKLPVKLNLTVQESNFNARREFYNYLSVLGNLPSDFIMDNVVAYRFDLNDDGTDEIIGAVRHPGYMNNNGLGLYILIKKEIYKTYHPVPEPDEDKTEYYSLTNLLSFYSGIYILPTKTNGFYDLQTYEEGEMERKSINNYNHYKERFGYSGEYSNGTLLRFSSDLGRKYGYNHLLY